MDSGIISVLLFLCSISMASSSETDLMALLTLKQELADHTSPNALSSWNGTVHYCDWPGVSCSRKHPGRVVSLDLASFLLAGSISPAIGNLSFTTRIQLAGNELYGEIPPDIGRLHRLRYLNLSFNAIQGMIPLNLTRCTLLQTLDLRNNRLTGQIPAELGSLFGLEQLVLSNNNLTGAIPPSLGNLTSLAVLSLRLNQLESSIPDGLGKLVNIQHLQLYGNMLSGAIPLSIFNLSSLSFFSVASNRLNGSLPASIGNTLQSIQTLYLGDNRLSGRIPASLSNASTLQEVDLSSNNFIGEVPSDLGKLQLLSKLNLGWNQLIVRDTKDWRFFDSLTNCSNLQYFLIEDNRIAGTIPNSIANLSEQLQMLNLAYNQISGAIPSGIANLVNLDELDMGHNLLTGAIPKGIGQLSRLQQLTMFNNRLSGHIPSSLGNLTQLVTLYLFGNNLQGPLPPSFGNLQQLRSLALSNNSLSGSIPTEMFKLVYLSDFMDLSNNFLSGSLPSEVGNMKNLAQLDVSRNNLSGEIPDTIGNCQILQLLSLHNNLFEGSIPQALGNLKGLEMLYLSRNRLSGIIPLSLGNMKGLHQIDLSHNNLSGPIPESLENLDSLYFLDLSFNHFQGDVPTKGVFQNLSAVVLLGNDGLCGGIPDIHLPACSLRGSDKRRGWSQMLKIGISLISVAVFLVLVIAFAFFTWKKIKNKSTERPPAASSLDVKFPRISYVELVKATNDFSPANLIGRGSYGSVFKGILEKDNAAVAVKVFDLQQQGALKSFISECEALQSIRHRNLVKIQTCCSSIDSKGNDFKALVYDFMPNGSLEAWLHSEGDAHHEKSHLSLIQRLNVATDVADALEYLHHSCQPPILHCDLKPSNVLLDNGMNARLGDFGLAKFLSKFTSKSLQESTSSVGIRGTIGYIPPEYGAGGQVSTSGDVYSFGILVLEMLTGRRPVDDTFKNGLDLQKFAEMHVSLNKVTEIVDTKMLADDCQLNAKKTFEDYLVSMIKVGLSCSNPLPNERLSMRDVATEVHAIRDAFLEFGVHGKSKESS